MKSYRAFLIGGETIKMYKEHRIRARDQHLVYHFILGWLIALLISWMGVFYFQEFRQFDISRYHFLLLKLFGP